MFDEQHYVPILKGKKGELDALREISPEKKKYFTPLIEVPPIPWDFAKDEPSKTIDDYLSPFPGNLSRSWGETRPIFLDMALIPDTELLPDGRHPFVFLGDSLRQEGFSFIPVTGLFRDHPYQDASLRAVQENGNGLCLRIQAEDLDEDLVGAFDSFLEFFAIPPTEIDLLIDMGAIAARQNSFNVIAARGILSAIPNLSEWRTLTLASAAFPEDLSGFEGNSTRTTNRGDWQLWRSLVSNPGTIARLPTFGDYAISHPETPELDPRIIQPSASVRYTADDYWLVVKGRGVRSHGFEQFHSLCRHLISRQEYTGSDFSWGDFFISECAAEKGKGNLTTWRKVGTNHHIKFVLHQLSNFF